ncbi:hypothetical protein LSO07_18050 [Janthinobacterium sp. PLB04]|uniref:DUF6602 domain-containing protein n=1 Tax=Janthinobacterium lividum TaxID=29581 RepID=A0AAJ4MPA6_9BURK|nr:MULTISPECIES: DUF6602 domain-containing protein [Janthinobacterium]KAB0325497.1 hypothetical protein F3B38_17780 [Janthinobacterium lividum]QSX94600.1 hypothetical protein J3P46_17935 [Janthinobacterium lividum]UGQ34412.1 hypothetical protein LSO07_18050 [Janthinobacterium sp. PLB04]
MAVPTDPTEQKRHLLVPPYSANDFVNGEFVYLPDTSIEESRFGTIVERNGKWFVVFPPTELAKPCDEFPLDAYPERLGRAILIQFDKTRVSPGAAVVDSASWLDIKEAILSALRAAPLYRLRIDEIREKLDDNKQIDHDLVEDVLRMCASTGVTTVTKDKGGTWYNQSELLNKYTERRRYLATFSEELLVKSRRIDHLIQHTGTVGSYREGLLRSLLRQVVPQQYEVSTGFLENCPRQLDIIIWDAHRYGALFRDGDIVVVPSAAVRAVIEVKTTLGTQPLDEALEILDEVMRIAPPRVPIFKGIFAFESEYEKSKTIAQRVKNFQNSQMPNGLFTREHQYLFQGVQAICVPKRHLVRNVCKRAIDTAIAYPQPAMEWYETIEAEDMTTAAFIYDILMFLDIEPTAKRTQLELFWPLLHDLSAAESVQLFADTWQPRHVHNDLIWTGTPIGSDRFVDKFHGYRSGQISAEELVTDS